MTNVVCDGLPGCTCRPTYYYKVEWNRPEQSPDFKKYHARCISHQVHPFPESFFKIEKISKKIYLIGDVLET